MVLRVLFQAKQLAVVSAGDDGEVRVWDLVTKACTAGERGGFMLRCPPPYVRPPVLLARSLARSFVSA